MHITVVMSVYNDAHTVTDAIRSICDQTYSDWDFIIINDGSTDETPYLLETIAQEDSRITIKHNDKNIGLAAALNKGWKLATGELIARMDADDISLPKRFECQVQFLQTYPEIAVLGTGVELINEHDKVIGTRIPLEQHNMLVQRIYKETPFVHPTVMMRRSFLQAAHGYNSNMANSQDADLWLRTYRHFRFHNLQEILLRYRIRNTYSFKRTLKAAQSRWQAGLREGRPFVGFHYALRFLVAGALTKIRIKNRQSKKLF